jgi:hypothetical protein
MEDNRELQVEMATAMKELLEDKRFKMLFQDRFVDAFAITNVYNAWTFDDQARRRFLEKTIARSHFTNFINEIIEDGQEAQLSLQSETNDNAEELAY